VTLPASLRKHGRQGRLKADADEAHNASAEQSPSDHQASRPSCRSLRGLDWFVFFLADTQMGFGPLVAVYLTAQKWTQGDIGLVLTAGGLIALAGQMPGGALVDAARSERVLAAFGVVAIGASALLIGAWPVFTVVLAAKLLHSAASCILGPAIAALSLGLVGHSAIAERLGRNARFASIGAGLAAAGMGTAGYLISNQAVFFMTAALCVPTLFALWMIGAGQVDPEQAHGGKARPHPGDPTATMRMLVQNRPLIIFASCLALFHLANAAMLPLTAGVVTMRSGDWAAALVGACILVPQVVVAALAPWVGRQATIRGRRSMLLLGFGALPVRGVLLAFASDPDMLVAVQILDGISAAALAVLVPLVIADVTRGTGHFNLAQGVIGTAVGIGAAISTTLGGYASDHFGTAAAFLMLACLAAAGFFAVLAFMPETAGFPAGSNEFRRGALFLKVSSARRRG
jgi:predicted MFS family arabinose efflux permease